MLDKLGDGDSHENDRAGKDSTPGHLAAGETHGVNRDREAVPTSISPPRLVTLKSIFVTNARRVECLATKPQAISKDVLFNMCCWMSSQTSSARSMKNNIPVQNRWGFVALENAKTDET